MHHSHKMPNITESVNRQATDSSWAKLQVSDNVLATMDYDNYALKIFPHAINKDLTTKNEDKKYYFEPIGQLNHLSASAKLNPVSGKAETSFRVEMWNDDVRTAVYNFLAKNPKNLPITADNVRVLPLEKVMIYTSTVSLGADLSQDWVEYKGDRFLTFKYTCAVLSDCNYVSKEMQSSPDQFTLKMRFTLSSQKSQSKDTKINILSVMSGSMMSTLDQRFHGQDVLLTAADKDQLLKETSTNIIVQTLDDTDVPSSNTQDQIYKIVENLLQFSRATIAAGDAKAWESLFWNNDNYRPDKVSKTLNDVYSLMDTDAKKSMSSEFTDTKKVGVDASFSGFGAEASVKVNTDFSKAGSLSTSDAAKLLKEAKSSVEWNGEKFVPKQMSLSKMNMARLSDSKAFQDTTVKVAYTTSMLTIAVQVNPNAKPDILNQLLDLQTKASGLKCSKLISRLKLYRLHSIKNYLSFQI